MLVVKQLTKSFQGNEVVHDISFTLQEKKVTALIGPNGAGKTTILSMLAGILQPTSGSITMNERALRLEEIGFLPQYPKFFEALTAREFLEMCGQLNGMQKEQIKKRADEILAFVGLEAAMHKKTSTFSGGMKQRLGIAQAIFHKPKLLLLDEPVSALDPVGRREMMALLKVLQEETTILYSTHILNDAEQMTDDVLFIKDGKLVESGSLQTVKAKYAEDIITIEVSNIEQIEMLVKVMPFNIEQEGMLMKVSASEDVTMRKIYSILAELPFDVVKVEKQRATLEEIFMKVAGR